METGFTDFWQAIKDLCFPPLCLACGKASGSGAFLFCESCAGEIKTISSPVCRQCGRPFPDSYPGSHLCGICLSYGWHFTRARALALYRDPLAKAIQSFKYAGNTAGVASFAVLKEEFPLLNDLFDPDLILPVPLHFRRLRERGFNQALMLAQNFFPNRRHDISAYILERYRSTPPQAGLNGLERRKNIKNAFRVRTPEKITGCRILLVDDVYTTGATVDECARILMKAGAREVQVLTLARVEG